VAIRDGLVTRCRGCLSDCNAAETVIRERGDHRQQPLRCCHAQHRCERQHRTIYQLAMTFEIGHERPSANAR
jgi:hypothetical protein